MHGYMASDAKLNQTEKGDVEIAARTVPFTLFAACRGTRNDELRKSFLAQVTKINVLFDAVVARCPSSFSLLGLQKDLMGIGDVFMWLTTWSCTTERQGAISTVGNA